MIPVAALYVERDGCYADQPGVDPWDERRDARLYAGPFPVVAHPPCARWCRLAGLCEHRWGVPRGQDGGTFAAALESVRRFGGVLEHPAYSDAWSRYEITPPRAPGWQRTIEGAWVCQVDQGHYGHRSRKPTWLYVYGAEYLPKMPWTPFAGAEPGVFERMGRRERNATPRQFRDLLLSIARSVSRVQIAAA